MPTPLDIFYKSHYAVIKLPDVARLGFQSTDVRCPISPDSTHSYQYLHQKKNHIVNCRGTKKTLHVLQYVQSLGTAAKWTSSASHRYTLLNLLGGITLLPNSVPKAVQSSSSAARSLVALRPVSADRGNSYLSPNDYFTTTVTGRDLQH